MKQPVTMLHSRAKAVTSLASRLRWTAVAAMVSACGVGELTPKAGSNDAAVMQPDSSPIPVDASQLDSAASVPDAAPPDAFVLDCDDPVSSGQSGRHEAGNRCMTCHNGTDASRFTIAGTLYSTKFGAEEVPDATVHIVDASDTEYTAITAANGNFWTYESLFYPVRIWVSKCPDTQIKAQLVDEGGADCNRPGCHEPGLRIHLP